MSKNSKAFKAAAEKVDRTKLYSPLEAMALAKDTSSTKMDATVEVAMRLGVDSRKADQMVRGTVNLPHGTGKTARVIVFAAGEKATEAEAAGQGTSQKAGQGSRHRTRTAPRPPNGERGAGMHLQR